MTDDNISTMARAIAQQEGFGVPGARPTRNHNCGDLRGWPGYPVDEGGFSIFPDDETGWAKLREDIGNHANRWPGQSLGAFVGGDGTINGWTGYAPASDSNDPVAYAAALAKALGCEVSTTFCEL